MLKGFISAASRMMSTAYTAENMIYQPSLQSASRFRTLLDKWRVAFLALAISYGLILLFSLTHYPLEWDEVVHLNGALSLLSGHFVTYINNAFYPPLFDGATAFSFNIFGVSLLSARFLSVIFSVLSLSVIFELAYSMYGGKIGLISTVLLAVMPGYFWLSRMALLETMLLFFFTLALLFFYYWLKDKKDRYIFLSGLSIGLGILTKYQMVIALIVIAVSILFLARGQLKKAFSRFSLLVATTVAVVAPWVLVAYEVYASRIFDEWIYALQVGNPNKFAYSGRYPTPIFYLIEMVWPYDTIHPISIFLYALGLAGLVFLVIRHNKGDKFVLIWFVSTFVFFTFITNKEWRYVLPLFPALAISAAVIILFSYGKIGDWVKKANFGKRQKRKFVAGLFVVVVAGAMAYSVYDSYTMTSYFDITIELEPATLYAMNHMQDNQSIMVLSPFNFFSQDMISFYLAKNGNNQIRVSQYPALPVDTYTPNFNISELIALCKQNGVKFLFTYENGGTATYYNTTLNLEQIYIQLYDSKNFSDISQQATFGSNPRRIFILTFLG